MVDGSSSQDVIRCLKAHKVLTFLVDANTQTYTLERGDFMETVILTGYVGKRYINYLRRKLNIPIHHFWNPEMAEQAEQEDKDC